MGIWIWAKWCCTVEMGDTRLYSVVRGRCRAARWHSVTVVHVEEDMSYGGGPVILDIILHDEIVLDVGTK